MRSILALALGLFSLQTAQAGFVQFDLVGGLALQFSRTTGVGGMDTVGFIDNGGVAGTAATFQTSPFAPTGLENLWGTIDLQSWKIGTITSNPGGCDGSVPNCNETASLFSTSGGAPPTTKFRVYDNNSGPTGNYIEADLAVNMIDVTTGPGLSSGSIGKIGFNLVGAWSSNNVGGLSAAMLNLYNQTSASAVISFGFSGGQTLEEALAATVTGGARRVGYTGSVTATPEPGFYGILAGGLGSLIWAFRRRKSEVA